MKAKKLIIYLQEMVDKHGDCEVDLLTDTEVVQTEQPLGDVAFSSLDQRFKLLPEGF
jgi:hypothetical protein